MRKKICACLSVLLLVMGRVYISYGSDGTITDQSFNMNDMADWTDYGKIVYPVTPSDDEWKELFTETERVEACQIPDEIISKLSSEELIDAVVEYPLIGTLYLYTDMQTGFDILTEQCNALKELLSRTDCVEAVKQYYHSIEIPMDTIVEWSEFVDEDHPEDAANEIIENHELLKLAHEDAKVIYACDLTEMILAVKYQDMEQYEIDEVISMVLEKKDQKNQSEIFKNVNDSTYIDIICETIQVNDSVQYVDGSGNTYVKSTLKSPSGNTFTVNEYLTSSNCNYEFWADIVAQTPYATIVTIAATTFNCHSYAWLSDIYPSRYTYYTLPSVPSALSDDPIYKKETAPNHDGEIVYWKSGLHSGKVNGTQLYQIQGHVSPRILSKWGGGPMVLHYLNAYDGYSCGVEYFYKK